MYLLAWEKYVWEICTNKCERINAYRKLQKDLVIYHPTGQLCGGS